MKLRVLIACRAGRSIGRRILASNQQKPPITIHLASAEFRQAWQPYKRCPDMKGRADAYDFARPDRCGSFRSLGAAWQRRTRELNPSASDRLFGTGIGLPRVLLIGRGES